MQVLRQNKLNANMGGTSGGSSLANQQQAQQTQGLTALLVMIAVLCILLAYCFWGAPWCRSFCRKRICCFCPMDDPEGIDNISTAEAAGTATPTIILLPFGRMLVVDGSVIAQLQADSRGGLDLMELGENIIRNQRYQTGGSTPSILQIDSETTSKGLPSPLFETFPPPTYDSIFGSRFYVNDLPPSYSEISLQMRNLANQHHYQSQPQMHIQQIDEEDNQDVCPENGSDNEDIIESSV